MAAAGCLHADAHTSRLMCAHLLPADQAEEHVIRFTGCGADYVLACRACADAPTPELVPACEACLRECEDSVGSCFGVRGTPEVRSRPSALTFAHRDVRVPGLAVQAPIAVAPLADGTRSSWLAISAGGALTRIDLDEPHMEPVANVDLAPWGPNPDVRIVASPDGRFAAVVAARGSLGVVLDLATGARTLELDRGQYHVKHCEFSIAFLRDEDRTIVVHATKWNRLDLSDVATGRMLSARPSPEYAANQPLPSHYLDYFHCGLTVSPDGRWLVDDGWIWHPLGCMRSLDLRRWLHENVWESEDGASLRDVRICEGTGDRPRCFIDDNALAVWGLGSDGDFLVDAALLIDVETGRRIRWFAGPPCGRFFFDRHLIVAAEGKGTSVWDVTTGERLLDDPAFVPVAHHPAARTFLSVLPDGVLRESRMIGDA